MQWPKIKIRRTHAIALVLLVVLGGLIYRASVFRPFKNFHVVDEGKFYRSAQLSPDELEQTVREYGIKSVINLRGTQQGEPWFDAESATLNKLGVKMENLGFTSEHLPSRTDLVKYLDALDSLPRPILIHCRAGSDRTGEAAAVYMIEKMNASKEEALKQLTFDYLHVPLFQPAKRFFVRHYRGKDWARSSYDPCSPEFIKHASGYDCPNAPKTSSLGAILGYHNED